MKALTFATLALVAVLTGPATAGTWAVDLPHLTFPDPVVTPSTKDCGTATTVEGCQPKE